MRELDELFSALAKSGFRSRFRLGPKERAYLVEKTLPTVLEHGRQFIQDRLALAAPRNDGRQTPMRGHPIFIAQHATATCCRGCLKKWHRIPRGRLLSEQEIQYVLARWLDRSIPDNSCRVGQGRASPWWGFANQTNDPPRDGASRVFDKRPKPHQ